MEKKTNLVKTKKQFNLEDLVLQCPKVIQYPNISDELLLQCVTETINKLNDELHTIGRLSDKETIIFSIVKDIK